MLKRALIKLLNFAMKFASPATDKYAFVSFTGHYYDNLRYFSEFIISERMEAKVIWLYGKSNVSIGYKKTYKMFSLVGLYHLTTAEIIVLNGWSNSFVKLRFHNRKLVQLHHGMPLKMIGRDDKSIDRKTKACFLECSRQWDILSVPSASSIDRFMQSTEVNPEAIKITGYPRNDILFAHNSEKADANSQYDKVIVYMPTWRPFNTKHGMTEVFDADAAQDILAKLNYKFIIKPHMNSGFDLDISKCSNIEILSQNCKDAQDLLIEADVLVSDYSSVVIDYALLERPIIFYCYDYAEYEEKVGLYEEIEDIYDGPVAYNFNELLDAIVDLEKFCYDSIRKFKNRFHDHCDSNSSRRVYAEIARIRKNN